MQKYWQKYADELDEDDAYQNICRSFYPEDEDHYTRGGISSSNINHGNRSSSSYHTNSELKLKELAKSLEKIQDFFIMQGIDYKLYLEPIQPRKR